MCTKVLSQIYQFRDFPTSAGTKPISNISEPWPSLVRRTFLYQDNTGQWLELPELLQRELTWMYLDVLMAYWQLLGCAFLKSLYTIVP